MFTTLDDVEMPVRHGIEGAWIDGDSFHWSKSVPSTFYRFLPRYTGCPAFAKGFQDHLSQESMCIARERGVCCEKILSRHACLLDQG